MWYRCSTTGNTSLVPLSILDVQSIINQLYSDMLFNRNDCSYKTEKKLDETLRIIRRVFSCHLKWGASSRWSFGPKSVWSSIETTTIGKTHPTLQWCYSEHDENLNKSLAKVKWKGKDPVPHIHVFNFVHGSWPSMVRPKFGHYSSMVNSLHLNPQKGRYNVFAATNATRIYS